MFDPVLIKLACVVGYLAIGWVVFVIIVRIDNTRLGVKKTEIDADFVSSMVACMIMWPLGVGVGTFWALGWVAGRLTKAMIDVGKD